MVASPWFNTPVITVNNREQSCAVLRSGSSTAQHVQQPRSAKRLRHELTISCDDRQDSARQRTDGEGVHYQRLRHAFDRHGGSEPS